MSLTPSRRAFLTTLAAGACGLTFDARRATANEEPVRMPVIDTHQHLWDLSKFRLAWTDGNPQMARNWLLDDYRQATEGIDIVKTVYMEVDVAPDQQAAEADWILELCADPAHRIAGAVISGRPAQEDFRPYITRYKENPFVKGVRQILHGPSTPAGYCLQPSFIESIRLLGQLGLSFDLCMRPIELSDAARLIEACPDTQFILDHCGNADVQQNLLPWKQGIDQVARHENVVCKVSGIVVSAAKDTWTADDLAPAINHVIEAFGEDRLVFGGDWPVCTHTASYQQWFAALTSILQGRGGSLERKLLHDNALRVYQLT